MSVGPAGNLERASDVMYDLGLCELRGEVIASRSVSLHPMCQVFGGSKVIRFGEIAPGMGEHEIMTQVDRVARPGDKMIDVALFIRTTDFLATVETACVLHLTQDRQISGERHPFASKKKLVEIGRGTECILIVPTDITHLGTAHQIGDKAVEAPKAVHDSGLKFDECSGAPVSIKELHGGLADDLQFPERHLRDDATDLAHDLRPVYARALDVGKRPPLVSQGLEGGYHGGWRSGILA